jgi:peptidoglycan/LPS O-acetylase OafA/YrhL
MVVAVHVGFNTGQVGVPFWGGIVARLDSGVAIFFVLSGFLLFRPFVLARATGTKNPSVGRYLLRRALRILPAYWLVVVVVLLALPANRGTSPRLWAEYLTLSGIYDPYFLRAGLVQTWSLCTEVAFYLVLPLVAWVALLRPRWSPRATLAVTVGLGVGTTVGWLLMMKLGVGPSAGGRTMWLPTYAAWFGGGMALATVHAALTTKTAPRAWRVFDRLAAHPLVCWAAAAGLLVIVSTPLGGPWVLAPISVRQEGTKLALEGLIAALALIPLAFGGDNAIKRALSTGPARWVGTVSYGVFLWHLFILEMIYLVAGWPLFTGSFFPVYLLTVGLSLVVAAASWYVFERPILNLDLRWRRQPGPISSTAAREGDTGEAGRDTEPATPTQALAES